MVWIHILYSELWNSIAVTQILNYGTHPVSDILIFAAANWVSVNPKRICVIIQLNLTQFYESTNALRGQWKKVPLFYVIHHATGTDVVKCLL